MKQKRAKDKGVAVRGVEQGGFIVNGNVHSAARRGLGAERGAPQEGEDEPTGRDDPAEPAHHRTSSEGFSRTGIPNKRAQRLFHHRRVVALYFETASS